MTTVCSPLTADSTQHTADTILITADATEFCVEVLEEAAGGGTSRRLTQEQYFRRIFNERIDLPSEPKAKEVAVEVLDEVVEVLEDESDDFAEKLALVESLERRVATFIESYHINEILRLTRERIQAQRDQEIAARIREVERRAVQVELEEFEELIELL